MNKYFLIHIEKKHWGTVARTLVPHAQGLGQQYCRLKELQGQMMQNSLFHTAGLKTVVYFRKKSGSPGKEKAHCRQFFYCYVRAHISLLFVYFGQKRGWPLASCSFLPCSSLALSYLMAWEGHHRCPTKVIDSQAFGREVCPNSERL